MSQPTWKLLANLGDAHPLRHGGYFVYRDETGVYAPEAEVIEPPPDHIDLDSPKARWTIHRFILEPCTYIDGVLSDNPYHPELAAWFAQLESRRVHRPQDTTYLANVADCAGLDVDELRADLCSGDPIRRAYAYRSIGEYHGFENLDQYPLELTRDETRERYPDHASELD